MSIVNPCNLSETPANTGIECGRALKAAAALMMTPKGDKWTQADIDAAGGLTAYATKRLHDIPAKRWFAIFGTSAPIRNITDAKESDVLETMEDGSVQFIRYGMYNRTFLTTDGGLCMAQALMAMRQNYDFWEIDIIEQVGWMVNPDGSFSGFPVNLAYAPAPELANLKTSYKNAFMLSFSPSTYIKHGKVYATTQDEDVLSLRGLYDSVVYKNGNITNSGSTRATATDTIVKGATGDKIDLKVAGVSLGGVVIQTGTETTDTLLAAKIAAAITAAVLTNGGYTATNAAGVLTISAAASKGATANGLTITADITGTITQTPGGAFAGGVTGTMVIPFGLKTECAETDLIAIYGTNLVKVANVVIKNSAGAAVVPSVVSIVAGVGNATIPYLADTYTFDMIEPTALLALNISGYDFTTPAIIVVP